MDQHPIPQDVTGFQFKLIGSMTVKQFGYVAVGVITAVILYYLPLQGAWAIIFKLFFIPLIGSSGFIVAFVPIEGRPIDLMATNFAKAIFSPNQYVYRKVGRHFVFSTVTITTVQKQATPTTAGPAQTRQQHDDSNREQRLQSLLLNSQGRVKNDLDQKEVAFLKKFAAVPVAPPVATQARATTLKAGPTVVMHPAPALTKQTPVVTPPVAAHTPTIVHTQPVVPPLVAPIAAVKPQPTTTPSPAQVQKETPEDLMKKETALVQQLAVAKQEESAKHTPEELSVAHKKVQTLEKEVQEIHQQKEALEQELIRLKSQLAIQKGTPAPIQQPVAPTPNIDPQHVREVSQAVTKKVGLPHIPDTPNVVVGIVKDPRGNVLPNILVEVKDKDENPVRAFKTNALGQFASATPLSQGMYTIELEDPKKQHTFNVIQITANNQIMLPIEIISQDAREELRKQLFN